MRCADCSSMLPTFDNRSAFSLAPTLQWKGIHWMVTEVLFLSRDSSCLDVAEDLVPSCWLKTLQDGPAVSQKHCVGRKSLCVVQSLDCCKQGAGFSCVAVWLLPCSYRLPDGSAVRELDENSTSAILSCLFCWPMCVSSCPGGRWVGSIKGFQGQWPQLFIYVVFLGLDAWDV